MKQLLKERKGITLIALVITIIILLILAGVIIATLTGEGGILNKAIRAKNENNQGTIEEEVKSAYITVQMDSITNGWDLNKKVQELQKELRKQDGEAIVTVFQSNLMISYKGYEVVIDADEMIGIEDPSLGDKPTGVVTILTTDENVELVEIQVEASTTDGDIETIEAMNGAIEKEGANNTNTKKIFTVSKNGIYYFRIKGTNGRTATKESEEIKNIIKTSDILTEIEKIETKGEQTIELTGRNNEGKIEKKTYSLDVILHKGTVILNGETEIEGAILNRENKEYKFGNESDVATGESEEKLAKNTVVLKIEGDLKIEEGVVVSSLESSQGFGGPKGMIIYCTGTLTNQGKINMSQRGAYAKGENVYLWNNNGKKEFEYVPQYGAKGANSNATSTNTYQNVYPSITNAKGIGRQTAGGASGGAGKIGSGFAARGGIGGQGTSYSGGRRRYRS